MLDRTQAPEAFMLDDLALSQPSISTLKNQLKLHSFIDGTNPVIKVNFLFPFGKVNDKVPGQAQICAKLLTEGTKSYPGDVFQNTLDHYGAHLDVAVDYDTTTVTLLCLKTHVNTLLPLLKSVMTEPLFDQADFDKIKFQQIQKIKVNAQKSAMIATKLLRNKLLSGTNYSIVLEEEHLSKLLLPDIIAFYDSFYKHQPELIIAGDISDAVIKQLNDSFGTLDFSSSEVNFEGDLVPDYSEETFEKPGSVQASIRLGALSIPKKDADYFALSIANEILGGYFGSRLMKNIREDKGYTYGIYSMIVNQHNADYHIIGADVKLDFVNDAIAEIHKEINKMQMEAVTSEELETVKNYMLGKLAGNLDTIFSQAENYKSKLSEGVSYQDYFDAYVHTIRTITPARILEVSKKYFSSPYCEIKVI